MLVQHCSEQRSGLYGIVGILPKNVVGGIFPRRVVDCFDHRAMTATTIAGTVGKQPT